MAQRIGMLLRLSVIVLPLLLMQVAGCTHIHNAENAKLANNLNDEFIEFKKSSRDVYKDMLSNLEIVRAREKAQQEKYKEDRVTNLPNEIGYMTWSEIKADLEMQKRNMKELEVITAKLVRQAYSNNSSIKETAKLVAAMKADIESTSNEIKVWRAHKVLYSEAINIITDVSVSGELDKESAMQAKDRLLEAEVEYQAYDKTSNKFTTETQPLKDAFMFSEAFNNSTTLDGTISSLGEWFKKASLGGFLPSEAPGLKITMLSLALDLAEARIMKLNTKMEYYKSALDIHESMKFKHMENYSTMHTNTMFNIDNLNQDERNTVLYTLNTLRKNGEVEQLTRAMHALNYYSILTTIYHIDMDYASIRLEMLKHEHSIKESEINAMESEAFVGRSLEGLAAYHNGGLKTERVTNILHAASVIALGVIGGGLY